MKHVINRAFAIAGTMNHPDMHGGDAHNDFVCYKFDDEGEIQWQERYDLSDGHLADW